jgi:hypothetical protein
MTIFCIYKKWFNIDFNYFLLFFHQRDPDDILVNMSLLSVILAINLNL